MKSPARTFPWTVIIGLILLFLALALAFLLVNIGRLKAAAPLPKLETVGDFSLTNELGAPVSLADLKGSVWVADIIFTRCP
ncbi:MAG TPA: SCO family protein, partial [Verrucomicrobiae bacterium]|nr:SCO family protein [Verrucomicrobiae bacterium]